MDQLLPYIKNTLLERKVSSNNNKKKKKKAQPTELRTQKEVKNVTESAQTIFIKSIQDYFPNEKIMPIQVQKGLQNTKQKSTRRNYSCIIIKALRIQTKGSEGCVREIKSLTKAGPLEQKILELEVPRKMYLKF